MLSAPSLSAPSEPSIIQTCSRVETRSRTSPIVPACLLFSANAARAPESLRIHSTCSADEVS